MPYERSLRSRARTLVTAFVISAIGISALLTAPTVLARFDADQSVVKLAKDLWQQTDKNPIGFLNRAMPRYGDKNTTAYQTWHAGWCPATPQVHDADGALAVFEERCRKDNGTIDRFDLYMGCLSNAGNDPSQVLFAIRLDIGHYDFKCHEPYPGKDVDIYLIEPKPGHAQSAEYLQQVAAFGYAIPHDRQVKLDRQKHAKQLANEERMLHAQMAQDAERARVAKELPLLKKRGTRVCQTNDSITYVGFVDDVNEDGSRIRVLVKGTTTGFAPGGWQPGPEWAEPTAWHVCE